MQKPTPWYVTNMTCEEFLLGMLELGVPLEVSLVGSFDSQEGPTRASRRDVDLPLHQDGVRSEALATLQGGLYVEKEGVDYVGLYCLRQGESPCYTLLEGDFPNSSAEVDLKQNEALVFDNHRLLHGRKGSVGNRVLIRFWVKER